MPAKAGQVLSKWREQEPLISALQSRVCHWERTTNWSASPKGLRFYPVRSTCSGRKAQVVKRYTMTLEDFHRKREDREIPNHTMYCSQRNSFCLNHLVAHYTHSYSKSFSKVFSLKLPRSQPHPIKFYSLTLQRFLIYCYLTTCVSDGEGHRHLRLSVTRFWVEALQGQTR